MDLGYVLYDNELKSSFWSTKTACRRFLQLAVLFIYFLQEKEGWAAERSRSETTNVVSARHSRGLS